MNFFSSLANLLEGNFQILVNDMAILKAAEELTANENNKTGAVVWPTQGNIDTRNWSLPLSDLQDNREKYIPDPNYQIIEIPPAKPGAQYEYTGENYCLIWDEPFQDEPYTPNAG